LPKENISESTVTSVTVTSLENASDTSKPINPPVEALRSVAKIPEEWKTDAIREMQEKERRENARKAATGKVQGS